jgi:hypothetical protein
LIRKILAEHKKNRKLFDNQETFCTFVIVISKTTIKLEIMRTNKQHMSIINVVKQFSNCWYPRMAFIGSVVDETN